MATTNSNHNTGFHLSSGIKAAMLVVVVGMIAALAETTLVETREARRISEATEPATEVQSYYFPAQFNIGDAKAEPHVDAF